MYAIIVILNVITYLLSPIWRGFTPGLVNCKNGYTRLASDQAYQLLAHGRWFSPASSISKTGRYDIAEILLKVALNTNNNHNNLVTVFILVTF